MKKEIYWLFIILLYLSSCNEDKKNKYKDIKISEHTENLTEEIVNLKIIFPDTVVVNKTYEIQIEYQSSFDSIALPIQLVTNFNDSTKMRLITFLNYNSVKSPIKDENVLTLKDSMFVTNKTFTIKNISFKETGEFIYIGLIKDEIMYNHYNNKGVRDSVHFKKIKKQILKKVVVIE